MRSEKKDFVFDTKESTTIPNDSF